LLSWGNSCAEGFRAWKEVDHIKSTMWEAENHLWLPINTSIPQYYKTWITETSLKSSLLYIPFHKTFNTAVQEYNFMPNFRLYTLNWGIDSVLACSTYSSSSPLTSSQDMDIQTVVHKNWILELWKCISICKNFPDINILNIWLEMEDLRLQNPETVSC
jgi:hypothetical protein